MSDSEVAGVWCCGVLRYSLFVENPAYAQIAQEMYRVLRAGGYAINLEMYVDVLPEVFTADFERAGFVTRRVLILQRYGGRIERLSHHRRMPSRFAEAGGQFSGFVRSALDNPYRPVQGLRDYLFIWQKPDA